VYTAKEKDQVVGNYNLTKTRGAEQSSSLAWYQGGEEKLACLRKTNAPVYVVISHSS
jgi:hypothetical protein